MRPRRGDSGVVSAELAVAFPAVITMIALVFAVSSVAGAHVRCVDAARAGARLAARGEAEAVVRSRVLALAPSGARATLSRSGDSALVAVTTEVRLPLPGAPTVSVGSTAVADVELP